MKAAHTGRGEQSRHRPGLYRRRMDEERYSTDHQAQAGNAYQPEGKDRTH